MKRKGLNSQGLSRKDRGLMECLTPEPGTTTVSIDLCLHPDCEYLTPRGWVPVMNIEPSDIVWQVDRTTLTGQFVQPSRIIKQHYKGQIITYSGVRGSLAVTKDHRMLFCGQYNHSRIDKSRLRMDALAGDGTQNKSAHFTTFSLSTSISNYSEEEIWIACMLEADGAIYKGQPDRFNIQVSKPRKRAKVAELLKRSGNVYKVHGKQKLEPESWSYIHFKSPLLKHKEFDLSSLGANQVDTFVDALCFWDGSFVDRSNKTRRFTWCSVREHEVDTVQAYLVKSGYEARKTVTFTKDKQPVFVLSIRKYGQIRLYSSRLKTFYKETSTEYEGPVGCVTVPSSYILVRHKGQTFVVGNCAGEPSATSHFTQDRNYKYACFEGVGKAPEYKNGLLLIDDIYLMTMGVSPIGAKKMLEAFERRWPAGSFADQWLADPEVIKSALKKDRQIHKILALGLSYGMGPKKMVTQMYDQGFTLALRDAKAFFRAYWDLFSGIRQFADMLSKQIESDGYIVNPFGYRLTPKPHNGFNAFIQSSVSGIMHVFTAKLMAAAPWATWVTCIHDELIIDVPIERLEEFRLAKDLATKSLNEDLGWTVDIRTGFATGNNWFEAK